MTDGQTTVATAPHRGAPDPGDAKSLGGKYLTFYLDGEEYGVQILKVREIIGIMEITQLPQMPHYIKGVINLRGKVIPVVDLRLKFGMSEAEYTDETCVIVVDIGTQVGIIVDTVQEVADIADKDIEPPPALGGSVETTYLMGMGKVNGSVKILLDIDPILTGEDMESLSEAAASF